MQETLNVAKTILKGGRRGASRSGSASKSRSAAKKSTGGAKTTKRNTNRTPKVGGSKKIKRAGKHLSK